MYSLTRSSIDSQLARMQSGIRNVVRITNSMEMPSTPILYLIGPSQSCSSTNWKPGLDLSKSHQIASDTTNVRSVPQSAIQRALCFASEFWKHRIKAAAAGRNVTSDSRLPLAKLIARPRR